LKVKPQPTEAAANRPGVILGVSLIFLLIALLVAAIRFAPAKFQHGWGAVVDGIYLVTWGFMFLGAYYHSQSNFFFRALLWACEYFPFGDSKRMALLWSGCAFLIGGGTILIGLGVI
jgi:hypothetical protein